MSIELKGLDALSQALMSDKKLKAVKSAVKYHTAQLQENAMRRAAVDTGHMKRSITVMLPSDGLTGKVTSHADYSGYVEKGTRLMHAQPFMKPALNDIKPQFLKDLGRLK